MRNFTGIIACLGCGFLLLLFSCQPRDNKSLTPEATNSVSARAVVTLPNKAEKSKLIGEWIRTDAPYQVKISAATDSGSISAGYFNPKPIHVEKANWVITGDTLQVYIELRDVNYPGSNYTLQYVPGKDMLAGKYFQAVEGVIYEVEFIRTK